MLPIALRSDGRRAVIVGGGSVALRKAEALDAAGFPVFVVAPSIDARLHALLQRSGGGFAQRPYEPGDVEGASLAIAATGDEIINARVVADARATGVLVCDASDAKRGDFEMPATLRTGDVTVTVGSGSPAFSKRIVSEISAMLGPQYARAAETLARMRTYVKAVVPAAERAHVLQVLSAIPVTELATMNPVAAEHAVESAIANVRAAGHDNDVPASTTATLTCASRGSALAMTQTREVAARLAELGIATTILTIATTGDRVQDRPIDRLGSVNVFVKELEIALRDGRADYAVHSCKDLPSELPGDMQIAAISKREDPRDAFCSERFERFDLLPRGAVVGTSSPRRRNQLAAIRPDLEYVEMRGNVDTRLRKLREGHYDAIVLAMAGLNRLNAHATYTVPFDIDTVVPAVAQGALAVETRAGDERIARELRAAVNDGTTELCVACERAALRTLRAGCSAPVGVHARLDDGVLRVTGVYATFGREPRKESIDARVSTIEEAEAIGAELASRLAPPLTGRTVLLPRTQDRPSTIAHALRDLGADVVELRAGDAGPDPAERTVDMLLFPSSGSVAAASEYLERLRTQERRPRVAAMGPQSSAAALAAGFAPDDVCAEASVDAFVALAVRRLRDAQ
jgi:hydroxymethylbilane synthase